MQLRSAVADPPEKACGRIAQHHHSFQKLRANMVKNVTGKVPAASDQQRNQAGHRHQIQRQLEKPR